MTKPKAIVVGSGFGGISIAIRLQTAGFQVSLFEKRDLPGGRAYVFKDNGFTFDGGPTVITAPECIQELFDLAKKPMENYVQMLPVMPFYRLCWDDGYSFDYSNDDDAMFRQIAEKNPEDVEGYKRFLEYSAEVFKEGYTNLVHVPFLTFSTMLRCAPQLIKLQAFRSVYSMVAKYVKDDKLRQAFSFHTLLVGGSPFSTSSIYALIHHLERTWGVFFPKGGTGALVQGLVNLFKDLGGQVHLSTEVDQIISANGKVTGVKTKDGTTHSCELLVSNAEVMHTYRDLLRNEQSVSHTTKKLGGMDYSMSLFVLYFGTKKKYPNLAHHSILFGPRYKGLIDDIFVRGKVAEDFSLYLHAPCRSDPSLAPEGCDAFYVLSPVPNLKKSKVDWNTEAPKYADKILTYLEKYYMPGVKNEIVTQRMITPEYFKNDLNSHLGSAFSLAPTLLQSAYFRLHNRDKDLKGLYFVGAGTHPGAGVPGVINSAKATASVIFDDLREKRLVVDSPELAYV